MPPHEGDHAHDHAPGSAAALSHDTGLPVHRRFLRPGSIHTGALIVAALAIAAHAGAVFATPRSWDGYAGVALHAAAAALAYVFLANLTKRKLGAPLIAAALFAVHPLAERALGGPLADELRGIRALAAVTGALGAGVLFLRSPGKPLLLWSAALLWGASVVASVAVAALPVVLALGLLAYHDVEWNRLLTPRIRNRLLVFVVPAVGAAAGLVFLPLGDTRLYVFEPPSVVVSGSRALDCAIAACGVQETLREAPARFSNEPSMAPWIAGIAGWVVWASAAAAGLTLLRRHAAGFPLAAFAVALVPVLFGPVSVELTVSYQFQLVFLVLLAAEGLEHLYYRWGGWGLAPTILLIALLAARSWQG